jgi:hypothetical protein
MSIEDAQCRLPFPITVSHPTPIGVRIDCEDRPEGRCRSGRLDHPEDVGGIITAPVSIEEDRRVHTRILDRRRDRGITTATEPGEPRLRYIYTLAADGSALTRITDTPSADEWWPDWGPT